MKNPKNNSSRQSPSQSTPEYHASRMAAHEAMAAKHRALADHHRSMHRESVENPGRHGLLRAAHAMSDY